MKEQLKKEGRFYKLTSQGKNTIEQTSTNELNMATLLKHTVPPLKENEVDNRPIEERNRVTF